MTIQSKAINIIPKTTANLPDSGKIFLSFNFSKKAGIDRKLIIKIPGKIKSKDDKLNKFFVIILKIIPAAMPTKILFFENPDA